MFDELLSLFFPDRCSVHLLKNIALTSGFPFGLPGLLLLALFLFLAIVVIKRLLKIALAPAEILLNLSLSERGIFDQTSKAVDTGIHISNSNRGIIILDRPSGT